MQVSSKKMNIAFIGLAAVLFVGCANNYQPPPPKQMTQLEWRQMETRYYDVDIKLNVMKAVIAALQDEGFIINTANTDLGLITASKEITEIDKDHKAFQEFWYGKASGYQRARKIDATVTVSEQPNRIKVRINLTAKGIADTGGTLWSQPVDDEKIYQKIFSKIDKSVFLNKEHL